VSNTLLGIMMVDITNGTIGFLTSTGLVRVCIFVEIVDRRLHFGFLVQGHRYGEFEAS